MLIYQCLLWGLWRHLVGTAWGRCWTLSGRSGPRRCRLWWRVQRTGTWASRPTSAAWWPFAGWRWRRAILALRVAQRRAAPLRVRRRRPLSVCTGERFS